MLSLYDSEFDLFTSSLKTVHNGKVGGADEKLVYIKNDDATKYYTDITISYDHELSDGYGINGTTGWSVKLSRGSRQPTEQEWANITSGQSITVEDIGTESEGNDSEYRGFWIRIYCPGNSPAQNRTAQRINVVYKEGVVV